MPCVDEVGVMRRRRWRERKIAESGAIAVVVRIISHARLHAGTSGTVEVFTKALNTVSREDAEDFTLVVIELGRGFATEDRQIVAQEGLDASQTQVRQARAVVEQSMNALEESQIENLERGRVQIHTSRVRRVQ